jgi:hypothetical protein
MSVGVDPLAAIAFAAWHSGGSNVPRAAASDTVCFV